MIQLTQNEVNAFNIISQQSQALNDQLAKANAAQKAVVSLLEIKYNATFDEKTGQFEPKEKKTVKE